MASSDGVSSPPHPEWPSPGHALPAPVRCRGDAGFTLLELLVAIAVISVLIDFLVPEVQDVRDAATRAEKGNTVLIHQVGVQCLNPPCSAPAPAAFLLAMVPVGGGSIAFDFPTQPPDANGNYPFEITVDPDSDPGGVLDLDAELQITVANGQADFTKWTVEPFDPASSTDPALTGRSGAYFRFPVPINDEATISVSLTVSADDDAGRFFLVPVPASVSLVALGVVAVAALARRRR